GLAAGFGDVEAGHGFEPVADKLVGAEQVIRIGAPGDGRMAHSNEVSLVPDSQRQNHRIGCKFVAWSVDAESREALKEPGIGLGQILQRLELLALAFSVLLRSLRSLVDLGGVRQGLVRELLAVDVLAVPLRHLEDVGEANEKPALRLPGAIPPGRKGKLDGAVVIALDDKRWHAGDLPGMSRGAIAKGEWLGVAHNGRCSDRMRYAAGRSIEEHEPFAACRAFDDLGHVQ